MAEKTGTYTDNNGDSFITSCEDDDHDHYYDDWYDDDSGSNGCYSNADLVWYINNINDEYWEWTDKSDVTYLNFLECEGTQGEGMYPFLSTSHRKTNSTTIRLKTCMTRASVGIRVVRRRSPADGTTFHPPSRSQIFWKMPT